MKLTILLIVIFHHLGTNHFADTAKNVVTNWKGISIPKKYLQSDSKNDNYTAKVIRMRNETIDEKCKNGMDISIGFQMYTPYVEKENETNSTLAISGIFPYIIMEMLKYCCPASKVGYGRLMNSNLEIYKGFNKQYFSDISFPVYAQYGKDSTTFKDLPFISIATAPKITLLVPDQLFQERNIRTKVLMATILNTWPMLLFIICSAMLAGLMVWFLDRKKNSSEFPPQFFSGAWEGIWWAFVTMTTVGYGDRSPKSILARAFSITWILLGIIIICLFTGLISSALNISATPVFNIPGSKIGAVRGSVEYEVGVGMNAEMKAYTTRDEMLKDLADTKKLHAAMIDNFILSASQEALEKIKLRMEREINHPVTYGLVMAKDSRETEKCFRKYIRLNSQRIFEIIADKLIPVKNPTDQVRVEVEAAKKLFYQEATFNIVIRTEVGLLVAAIVLGILWEVFVRNKDSAPYRFVGRFRPNSSYSEPKNDTERNPNVSIVEENPANADIETLLSEYEEYHNKWVNKMKNTET